MPRLSNLDARSKTALAEATVDESDGWQYYIADSFSIKYLVAKGFFLRETSRVDLFRIGELAHDRGKGWLKWVRKCQKPFRKDCVWA